MEMMIKSPEDCPLARAPGIVADSPQRRFFAARGLAAESPVPPFFTGGGAQKKKIQTPNSKLQIPRIVLYELRMGEPRHFV